MRRRLSSNLRTVVLQKHIDRLDKLFAESMILGTKLAENNRHFVVELERLSDKIADAKAKLDAAQVFAPFVQTDPVNPVKATMTVYPGKRDAHAIQLSVASPGKPKSRGR